MTEEAYLDRNSSFCRADFIQNDFSLKKSVFYSDIAQNPLKTMQKLRKLAWENLEKSMFFDFLQIVPDGF